MKCKQVILQFGARRVTESFAKSPVNNKCLKDKSKELFKLLFFKNSLIVICVISVFGDTTMNGYNCTGFILRASR
jgi:hypothetical protein